MRLTWRVTLRVFPAAANNRRIIRSPRSCLSILNLWGAHGRRRRIVFRCCHLRCEPSSINGLESGSVPPLGDTGSHFKRWLLIDKPQGGADVVEDSLMRPASHDSWNSARAAITSATAAGKLRRFPAVPPDRWAISRSSSWFSISLLDEVQDLRRLHLSQGFFQGFAALSSAGRSGESRCRTPPSVGASSMRLTCAASPEWVDG